MSLADEVKLERLTMAALWGGYRDRVVPRHAGPDQVKQVRTAFYAGAMILFETITGVSSGLPEDRALRHLEGLKDEFAAFIRESGGGRPS